MKRPGHQMVQHREDPAVHTVVPGGSKRVVLISSKSHGSDWDLAINNNKDELHDSNNGGVESEDSGFQVDLVDSTVTVKNGHCDNDGIQAAASSSSSTSDMIVTSRKVCFSHSEFFPTIFYNRLISKKRIQVSRLTGS